MIVPKIEIDIKEREIIDLYPGIMNILLMDRTLNRNIVWATEDYENLGDLYKAECEIFINLITVDDCKVIQPRITKNQQNKLRRTKDKAEVFTPSWICNIQNNLIDKDWFKREETFNAEGYKSWIVNRNKIKFDDTNRTWEEYVDSPRMEITCGEAPYLVSRYDTMYGIFIPLEERIGILDRKLRVVNENTQTEDEWFKWIVRAFQSVYGYELNGDSLLIARENLLYTFIDNLMYKYNREPKIFELHEIATIISWNIWQMDGLDFTVPYGYKKNDLYNQNDKIDSCKVVYCLIKDWLATRCGEKGILEYRSLLKKEAEQC